MNSRPETNKRSGYEKIIRCGLALSALASALVTNAGTQDPISAWNQISETAVKTAGYPPPVAALVFAIVHLAIYDAVESIERRYDPYYTLAPGATGTPSAAAAKAGHDAPVGLFPTQSRPLHVAYGTSGRRTALILLVQERR